jgi:hypothetical protein
MDKALNTLQALVEALSLLDDLQRSDTPQIVNVDEELEAGKALIEQMSNASNETSWLIRQLQQERDEARAVRDALIEQMQREAVQPSESPQPQGEAQRWEGECNAHLLELYAQNIEGPMRAEIVAAMQAAARFIRASPPAPRGPLTREDVLELRSKYGWAKETIRVIESVILAKQAHGISTTQQPERDNWQQYATEDETTAQQVIERHRGESDALLRLLAQARKATQQPESRKEPLTDEEIKAAAMEAFNATWDADDETLVNRYGHGVYFSRFVDFARAVEAAHGIAPSVRQEDL